MQYIIAILLASKLVDNNEQARLEKHYDFNHEDIMNEFNRLYTKSMNDNKIDNDDYNESVRIYEEHKKNKKYKLSIF